MYFRDPPPPGNTPGINPGINPGNHRLATGQLPRVPSTLRPRSPRRNAVGFVASPKPQIPNLKLSASASKTEIRNPQAEILPPTDPRWLLALRTAELLQGPILPPAQRERLVRLGQVLGLSPFDANLVIAIVQDRARRGLRPDACPHAAAEQLRMVPLSADHQLSRTRRHLTTALVALGLLLETLLLAIWLH